MFEKKNHRHAHRWIVRYFNSLYESGRGGVNFEIDVNIPWYHLKKIHGRPTRFS